MILKFDISQFVFKSLVIFEKDFIQLHDEIFAINLILNCNFLVIAFADIELALAHPKVQMRL